jgi:hypothetical protein
VIPAGRVAADVRLPKGKLTGGPVTTFPDYPAAVRVTCPNQALSVQVQPGRQQPLVLRANRRIDAATINCTWQATYLGAR